MRIPFIDDTESEQHPKAKPTQYLKMNENNQQTQSTTPTHGWGVITEVDGGFNGRPAQRPKAKATQHIKAALAVFGPGEAINMTQGTWAKLHEAMSVLVEQPAQHEPRAIDQWRRIDKPELGWFDDSHERAHHADPRMEGRTLYTTPPAAQRKPLTQDQIVSIRRRDVIQFARAIEAAHGITEKGGAA